MIDRLSVFLMKYPLRILGVTALLCSVLILGFKSLEPEYGFKSWFKVGDPALEAYEQYEKNFGNDDSIVVVVHSPSGIFDEDSVRLVEQLTEKMWMISEVIRVESLANYHLITGASGDIVIDPVFLEKDQAYLDKRAEEVRRNDNVINYLVSKDLKTTVITAYLNPLYDTHEQYEIPVAEAKELLKSFEGDSDHTFHMTGSATVTKAYRDVSEGDFARLMPLLIILTMGLLYYVFRSWSLPIIIASLFGVVIFTTLGASGWLGITQNALTSCVPQILIAITLADSIHLGQTFAKMRAGGLSRREASLYSFQQNLLPTFLTSLTTAFGFVAFLASDVTPVRDLGILASLGVMLAWFITVGVLPAVFTYLPIPINKKIESRTQSQRVWILNYINWIDAHKKYVIGFWTLLFIVSIYLGSLNSVDSDPMNYYADNVPIKKANDFMRESFGASRGIELVIDSGRVNGVKDTAFLEKVVDLQSEILKIEGVAKVTSIVDIIGELNQAIEGVQLPREDRMPASSESVAQQLFLYSMSLPVGMGINHWTTMDYRKMRAKVLWRVEDSEETLEKITKIENIAESLGLDLVAAGKTSLVPKLSHYILATFSDANLRALILVFLTMVILCKSLKLGTLSMIPNAIPPVIAGTVMYVSGIKYDVGTVLVIAVVMGIAVDDTIHFVTHLREKVHEGKSYREAIIEVLNKTGDALLMTTVVLSVGFGVAVFSEFLPYRNFGMMTAISLFIALLADLMLLPALLLTPGIGPKIAGQKAKQ